jgi:hypothetical protein
MIKKREEEEMTGGIDGYKVTFMDNKWGASALLVSCPAMYKLLHSSIKSSIVNQLGLSELRCKQTAWTVFLLAMQAHWQEKSMERGPWIVWPTESKSTRHLKIEDCKRKAENHYRFWWKQLFNLYVQCTQLFFFVFFPSLVDEHGYQRISKAKPPNCQCSTWSQTRNKNGNLIIPANMEVHAPSLALHHDLQI